MGEIENLNINIQETNKQLDVLDKKIETVSQTTNEFANSNTQLNVSMVAMNQAISNLGGAVPSLTSAFQLYKTTQEQVNIACKAFAANPVGATIQLIATALAVINAIIDKFKERIASSEELTNKWNEATAALEPIMKAFNVVLDVIVDTFINLVSVITKGVEWVGKFGDSVSKFFGGSGKAYTDAANKAKDYAKLQGDIAKEERKRIEERGKSERKQGELREQIANAEGEAKKKLLQDLKDEIKLQTDAEIALNKKRIALLEYKQSLGPTSEAEKKALAELKAQNDKLIGEQGKQLAKIDKQINATTSSIKSNTIKKAKDTSDTLKKIAEEYVKARNGILKKLDSEYSRQKKETDAIYALEDARRKNEGELEKDRIKRHQGYLLEEWETYKSYYKNRETALKESIDSGKLSKEDQIKFEEELENLHTEYLVNEYKFQTETFKNELAAREEYYKQFNDTVYTTDAELADAYKQQVQEREEEFQNSLEGSVEYINETIDTILDNFDQLSRPQQMLFDMIGRVTAQIGKEIKAFHDLSGEEKNAASKTKLSMAVIGQAMNAATQTVNAFMAAKQSQIEQDLKNGKITEQQAKKEFEKTKKVQLAMAVIGMMGGIAQAISQAMQLGPIAGPIVGAINAALVATTAGIQIAKIKKMTLETADAEGGDGSVDFGSMVTSANYGNVNPLLDEGFDLANMNNSITTQGDSATSDQRVYIVEDDIQESNKRVEVRESTTTF